MTKPPGHTLSKTSSSPLISGMAPEAQGPAWVTRLMMMMMAETVAAMGWPKQEHTSGFKDNVVTGGISCSEEVHIPEYSQWELK